MTDQPRRPRAWTADGLRTMASVWATGQRDLLSQFRGYVADTWLDLDQVPPAIARHAVLSYSRSGGLVVDPDCAAVPGPCSWRRCGRVGMPPGSLETLGGGGWPAPT